MENLKLQAASMGVDPSRIIFAPFVSWQKNVERGFAADLFLDTPMYCRELSLTRSAVFLAGSNVSDVFLFLMTKLFPAYEI